MVKRIVSFQDASILEKPTTPLVPLVKNKFSYLWAAQRRALALPLLSIDGTARQVSLEKVLLLTVALGTLRALRAFGDLHKGV